MPVERARFSSSATRTVAPAPCRPTVLFWRERYASAGLSGLLKDAPRPGRRPQISPRKVQAIVEATLETTPNRAARQ